MFEDLRQDLRHLVGAPASGRRSHLLSAFLDYGFQSLLVYRLGRWLREAPRRPARWLPALLLAPLYGPLAILIRVAYDIRLEQSATIGPGLKVFHFAGIRLRHCSLGRDCVIHQEVRVEPAPGGGPGPQIGQRVWIGPHARVIGPVRVGDGATVSAGAVVTRDVIARAVVVGSPARVVLADHDNADLL